jgi:hypothetical protein
MESTMILTLSLLLIAGSCYGELGYSNGDVIFYHNGEESLTLNEGILQIYIYRWRNERFPQGLWVNVCSEEFNGPAASAACRQLGYTDATSYGPHDQFEYDLNSNVSSYVLSEAKCPSVSNIVKYGENHILRCSYFGELLNISDFECKPVGIQCSSSRLQEYPYNGQLMLSNRSGTYASSISSGYLSMYYHDSWLPVCSKLSYFGATSACRQLGSTSTLSLYPFGGNVTGVYVGDPTCITDSYSCLDHCYNVSQFIITSCVPVHLVCSFVIENGPRKSSGSLSVCQYPSSSNNGTVVVSGTVVGLSVVLGLSCSLSAILAVSIVVMSIVYFKCHKGSNGERNKLLNTDDY